MLGRRFAWAPAGFVAELAIGTTATINKNALMTGSFVPIELRPYLFFSQVNRSQLLLGGTIGNSFSPDSVSIMIMGPPL